MRRTLYVCGHALSVVAAAALLTACGGSGNDGSAASSSGRASSSASGSSVDAASGFCKQAAKVQDHVAATFSGESDPSTLPSALEKSAQEIRAVEPPAELGSDWTSFADGIEQIAKAAQLNFKDPNAVATFQQKVSALQQQYGPAFTNVQTYLTQKCGLGGGPTESAAPSS